MIVPSAVGDREGEVFIRTLATATPLMRTLAMGPPPVGTLAVELMPAPGLEPKVSGT